tara:strand:- start:659 stop:979 length:321 start_codon:yes stop_codon:yes gene_type:complete
VSDIIAISMFDPIRISTKVPTIKKIQQMNDPNGALLIPSTSYSPSIINQTERKELNAAKLVCLVIIGLALSASMKLKLFANAIMMRIRINMKILTSWKVSVINLTK